MHHLEEDRGTFPLIYILEEGVYGVVISLGAYCSRVHYSVAGISYDTILENDEFFIKDEFILDMENINGM